MPNLFSSIPEFFPEEIVSDILRRPGFRVERIVSCGYTTPSGKWLSQDLDEWVVVLQGRAKLLFQSDPTPRELGPGDYVNIPARAAHRVVWTDEKMPTVWLAIHYSA